MEIAKVYPVDAVYDTHEDVPEDVMLIIYDVSVINFFSCFMNLLPLLQVKANKRYAGASNWTVKVNCRCNVPTPIKQHQCRAMNFFLSSA
jgi:enoyl-[acyl-carrier protein] reductase I